MDRLNPLLVAALADRALPAYEVGDPAQADAALTEADRQALDRLGSSEQLVRKLRSAGASPGGAAKRDSVLNQASVLNQDSAVKPATDTVLAGDRSTTRPPLAERTSDEAPEPEFTDLLRRVAQFEKGRHITWDSCYHLQKELGRGFQGVVFLSECPDALNAEQALKVFSPEPYGTLDAYRSDMERMVRVASFVQRIHHDNLLAVEQFRRYRDVFVMIMQRIDGFDLQWLLQPSLVEEIKSAVHVDRWKYLNEVVFAEPAPGRLCLKPGVAVNIIEKCLRGLVALHSRGIAHGDVKPSNIMLDCWGSIKLVDIGSAFELTSPPRRHTWTPRYAPPEFIERGEWTPRSDLASLGYVLIELLTGQPVVNAATIGDHSTRVVHPERDRALLAEKRDLPNHLDEILPIEVRRCKELVKLIRRLIDPDPERRFASASDAIEQRDGTFGFHKLLVIGDLAVYGAAEIMRWIDDVNRALS